MDTKLSCDEISVLLSLDSGRGQPAPIFRAGDLPQRLVNFNLVALQPSGEPRITESGKRALFRHECISALTAIARGERVQPASGIEKWLVSSGFIAPSPAGQRMQITSRGRLWLTSFEPDAKVDVLVPTAEHFAARRS
jgi:hypothetical protein